MRTMEPVSGGTQRITIRRRNNDEYNAALAQGSQTNEFTQGVQSGLDRVFNEVGAAEPIKASRSKYGNVNIMPQQVLDPHFNFQQTDTPANNPGQLRNDVINSTGNLGNQESATKTTQRDPQDFETSALDERLAKMAKGGMNNLNNISALYNV